MSSVANTDNPSLSSFPISCLVQEIMDSIPATLSNTETTTNNIDKEISRRLSSDSEDVESNSTIHAFNMSNVTVIEKEVESTNISGKPTSCEGSDSGVEVIENSILQRASSINSTNSQDFGSVTPACSFGSSIISCCSNYEEAYNLLARRNSTLFEDYKLGTCDGTSEGGSESSSVAGSASSKNAKRTNSNCIKKKINDSKNKQNIPSIRSRAPATPRNSVTRARGKSIDKLPAKSSSSKTTNLKPKTVPIHLTLGSGKKDSKSKESSRGSSSTRTPVTTPTDDGRWPSVNSKPAPLMSKSMRGLFGPDTKATIEKYGTLPRRRKEKSAENIHLVGKNGSNITRVSSIKRQSSTPKSLPPYPKRKTATKTKIYHEINTQTALTQSDIDKVFAGITCNPAMPADAETVAKEVQVDIETKEIDLLKTQLTQLQEKHAKLEMEFKLQEEKLSGCEQRLKEEISEKDGLKEELKQNTERVLAILSNDGDLPDDENSTTDSLMVLEARYQKVGQIMIKQENEISELNAICRNLQRDLERNVSLQNTLVQQHQELECESTELQEFMQAEKITLTEALKDAETEIKKLNLLLIQKDKDLDNKQEEARQLVRITEQKRQENIVVQARLGAIEIQSRELLKYQSAHISSASIALRSLIYRLEGLVEELVNSYNISEQELEDLIFHNEAYTHSSSSPDATPEKQRKFLKERSPSPKRGSFVSAIINAIKNATTQKPFSAAKDLSKDTISMENSDSVEMLDSETEPCLMMEHVLEDVVVPDGHSHNMISSGHGMISSTSLTCGESFTTSTPSIIHRQLSEPSSLSMTGSLHSEMSSFTEVGPSAPLVDQVIDVDNIITRLLKVLRIIQMENDGIMNELQDDRDQLSEQIDRQKEANKIVVKQLQDWEILGSHLKSEVTELMQQMGKKNNEIDNLKAEVNVNHKEIERLNEDVCTLSTICSKYELELKTKHKEVLDCIEKWESSQEMPTKEVLATIFTAQREIPLLKDKLKEKELELCVLKQEFLESHHAPLNSIKEVVGDTNKHHKAVDSALEILQSIQTIVQQCPLLNRLHCDLEDTSIQNARSLSVVGTSECNTNGPLLNPVNLEIPSPINSTA